MFNEISAIKKTAKLLGSKSANEACILSKSSSFLNSTAWRLSSMFFLKCPGKANCVIPFQNSELIFCNSIRKSDSHVYADEAIIINNDSPIDNR